jgi:hypothetical protein
MDVSDALRLSSPPPSRYGLARTDVRVTPSTKRAYSYGWRTGFSTLLMRTALATVQNVCAGHALSTPCSRIVQVSYSSPNQRCPPTPKPGGWATGSGQLRSPSRPFPWGFVCVRRYFRGPGTQTDATAT